VPSIAVSAITIYKGKEFNEWNGEALITSLKDKSMRKLNFKKLSNIEEKIIFKDKIGRIRDIQVHPVNGKIYFLAGNSLWLMEKKLTTKLEKDFSRNNEKINIFSIFYSFF
jgi:quinoprotein glucose dehydrogenase